MAIPIAKATQPCWTPVISNTITVPDAFNINNTMSDTRISNNTLLNVIPIHQLVPSTTRMCGRWREGKEIFNINTDGRTIKRGEGCGIVSPSLQVQPEHQRDPTMAMSIVTRRQQMQTGNDNGNRDILSDRQLRPKQPAALAK